MSKNLKIRKEFKFNLSLEEKINFLNVYKDNLNELYPERNVFSMYYDTDFLDLYKNSISTDVDKFKLRVRSYDAKDQYFFEIKENSSTGKKKMVNNMKKFEDYPEYVEYKSFKYYKKVEISYLRKYFEFKNYRLTIDEKLRYSHPTQNIKYNDNKIIFELKILNNENLDIEKVFFKSPIKFSKYEKAIQRLYYV
jgi:VTC domain.